MRYECPSDDVDRQVDWSTWTPRDRAVLLFVIRGGQALLIRKKRGLGAGKINAPGGRIEAGESPEEAAVHGARAARHDFDAGAG